MTINDVRLPIPAELVKSWLSVPPELFVSQTYQRFLHTGDPEVSEDMRERYDALMDNQLSGPLTANEARELSSLETEMDASDHAAQPPDHSWRDARQVETEELGKRLDALVNRIETAAIVPTMVVADWLHTLQNRTRLPVWLWHAQALGRWLGLPPGRPGRRTARQLDTLRELIRWT